MCRNLPSGQAAVGPGITENALISGYTFSRQAQVARGAGTVSQCGAVGDAWQGFTQNWQDEEAAWRFSLNVILHAMTH